MNKLEWLTHYSLCHLLEFTNVDLHSTLLCTVPRSRFHSWFGLFPTFLSGQHFKAVHAGFSCLNTVTLKAVLLVRLLNLILLYLSLIIINKEVLKEVLWGNLMLASLFRMNLASWIWSRVLEIIPVFHRLLSISNAVVKLIVWLLFYCSSGFQTMLRYIWFGHRTRLFCLWLGLLCYGICHRPCI